jgi:hypothetical protein
MDDWTKAKIRLVKILRKWHMIIFVTLMLVAYIDATKIFNLTMTLPFMPAIMLYEFFLVTFVLTHIGAIRLTKQYVYWFGWNVEKNPIMKTAMKRWGIDRLGLLSTIIGVVALLALLTINLSLIPEYPAISIGAFAIVAMFSFLDYANDFVAMETTKYLMNNPYDYSIYVKALPHRYEERTSMLKRLRDWYLRKQKQVGKDD